MSFSKQPKGLYLLFFTELWERFGFYSLQTIIILYMTRALFLSDDNSYHLYGAFSSMLYLTPVVGGYLADRVFGYQNSIIIGGILLSIGYLITAVPGPEFLFLGLSIVIIGNGFFKPNVSSIVGDLYKENDVRKEGGFTIFYMGINLGSLFPPLIAGAVVKYYGWDSGFIMAAIGIIIGLITFIGGRRLLKHAGTLPAQSPLKKGLRKKLLVLSVFFAALLAGIAFFRMILRHPYETNLILIALCTVFISFMVYEIFKEKEHHRNRMIACLILILISIGFWAVYSQTFTSLMLFADRNMNKEFLGMKIDAEFMQFFNPFFIITLSPMLSKLWIKLQKKHANPSTPTKFSIGVLLVALGFLFLGVGLKYFGGNGESSPWWLIGSYFLQTLGELSLSPIGLAMVTTLAPKRLVGMMMGIWFLTQSAAFAIAAMLASYASVPKDASIIQSLSIYQNAFMTYGYFALIVAAVSFMLIPYLKRLIHGPAPMNPIK